jgi:hypothetical protein
MGGYYTGNPLVSFILIPLLLINPTDLYNKDIVFFNDARKLQGRRRGGGSIPSLRTCVCAHMLCNYEIDIWETSVISPPRFPSFGVKHTRQFGPVQFQRGR